MGATQTNDPNAALACGSGNGTDRVFESSMHDDSFTSRMLKKSASFVLASLRSSTYRSVRLASSIAAALLNGLFVHPAWHSFVVPDGQVSEALVCVESSRETGGTSETRGSEFFGTSNPELRIAPFSHVTRFSRHSL
jgi:hypothetical protein